MAALTELNLRYLYQLDIPQQQRNPALQNKVIYCMAYESLIPFRHRSPIMTYCVDRFHQFKKMYIPLGVILVTDERLIGSPGYRYIFSLEINRRFRLNWYADSADSENSLYTNYLECFQNCDMMNQHIIPYKGNMQDLFDGCIYSMRKYQKRYFP